MTTDHLDHQTRAVFDNIHIEQANNPVILNRVRRLITADQLGVPADYFKSRICGDLGCGSAVPGTANLLDLGAKYVHAMDVNNSFTATATRVLESEQGFQGRWQLDVGTLAALPYKDDFFDFVLCQGVVHSVDDDRKALSEIARVLKKGGLANIAVLGSGGLMTRIVMDAMRDEYRTNDAFKALVDREMTPEWIKQQIDWLIPQIDDDGSASYRQCITLLESLRNLLEQDFILTVRDRMQAPIYRTYGYEEMAGLLGEAGFSSWRRVARKPTYRNVRKILAPLYHHYDSPLAKLMYGDGALILVAAK
ncbi:MAG: class I SAM-dependent methyltransferase [Proteobacteria bacterium]|nr:class I SAM-dependent methyltransferase [Pseudomonadota bacterium]